MTTVERLERTLPPLSTLVKLFEYHESFQGHLAARTAAGSTSPYKTPSGELVQLITGEITWATRIDGTWYENRYISDVLHSPVGVAAIANTAALKHLEDFPLTTLNTLSAAQRSDIRSACAGFDKLAARYSESGAALTDAELILHTAAALRLAQALAAAGITATAQ